MTDKSSFWIPVCYFLIGVISIQGGASLAKSLFHVVSPEAVTALRLAFSALMLLLVCCPWRRRVPYGAWRHIIAYGIALGSMNFCFYLSIARIPIGIAVAIEFIGPLSVAAFASKTLKDYLWDLLAIIGILMLMPFGEFNAGLDIIGIAFGFGSGLFWALYIIFGKRAGSSIQGIDSVAWGTLIAALIVTPLGFYTDGMALIDPDILPYGFLVGLFSSAIPYSMDFLAMNRIPTQIFGVLSSLEPAIAAFSGFLFLGEILNPLQWGAILCVMAASAGATLARQKA